MLGVIGVVDGLGIRNPCDVRLSLMRDQRLVVRSDVLKDGFQPGIVHHNVAALLVLQFHANVFPYLHRNRAASEILVEPINRGLEEIRLRDTKGIEGGAQRRVAMRGLDKCQRGGALTIERAAGGIFIVDNKDIHDVQIPSLQHPGESGIALENMRVCVNGMKVSKQPSGIRCGLAGTASGHDCGADGGPEQSLQSICHRVRTSASHGAVLVRRRLSPGTYLVETAPRIVTELLCSLEEPSNPVAWMRTWKVPACVYA